MPVQPDTLHLATELRTVMSRLLKQLRSQSAMHGQLSLTEGSVVKVLAEHQPLLPSELASREKVTTQAMSQILSHLLELGYITRQPSASDKRKVLIVLSAAGQAVVPTVRQQADAWLQQALAQTCSPAELACLRQALPILTKLVDSDLSK